MHKNKLYLHRFAIASLLLLLPCAVSLSNPNPLAEIELKRFQENRARAERREAVIQGLIATLIQAQRVVAEKKIENIETSFQDLQARYREWQANMAQEREWMLQTGLPAVALERHNHTIAQFDAKLQSLIQAFQTVRDNKVGQAAIQAKPLTDAEEGLSQLLGDLHDPQPQNPTPFRASPHERISERGAIPQSFPSLRPLAATGEPTPEDLAETAEVQFTPSITELAAALNHDALEIFQYVQNNVDVIPSYGSKKGASNTLLEKAGNDADTASLLIALLRVSNIPARYAQGKVQLTPQQAMEWLGVSDPWTAAQVIADGLIPHEVFVDADHPDTIVFIRVEHIWVEVYVPYGNYRGLGIDETNKLWIPLDASWKKYYYSQNLNIPDEMGFDVEKFYEDYLSGIYPETPLVAYQNQLKNYLSSAHPDLTYDDTLTRQYRPEETFDFLPNTLPYEVIEISGTPSALPAELRHQLQIKIADSQTTFLDTTLNVLDLANQQFVLSAVPATEADQAIIDQYGGLYNTPPYLVNLKPVLRMNGEEIARGSEYGMGRSKTLILDFWMPKKVDGGLVLVSKEHVEKETLLGNDEGIAINTDRIVLPELQEEETPSTEFVSGQKLYRTALNFLEQLQSSQEEIGKTFGATFTYAAARAIVFNGIDVLMVDGTPQTFTWKGLRIDSSANIRYYSYFGEINTHKKEFLMLWGVDGSYAEATLFDTDFEIEAIATVRGLTLINQGVIPGVSVHKITTQNQAEIETLSVSEKTKVTFRDAVNQGKVVYTPNQQFTYLNWTGLVYIMLDPVAGDGGYIIGEGLNGGYTVGTFSEGMIQFFINAHLITDLKATIVLPADGFTIDQGKTLPWSINYEGKVAFIFPVFWNEAGTIDTTQLQPGSFPLKSEYSTNAQVVFVVKVAPRPIQTYRNPTDSEVRPDLEKEHPCFDEPNYNCFDKAIQEAVDHWNNFFMQQKFPPPEPLEYNLVKAMIYMESGMGYHSGSNEPFPDVMQVGNPGDPAIPVLNNDGTYDTEYEAYTGKLEPIDYEGSANADTPDQSIFWGVRWLYHKLQPKIKETDDKEFPYRPKWVTWKEAIAGYGPGTTAYTEAVWNLYQKGIDPRGGKKLF